MREWAVLLDGNHAAEARSVLAEIAESLKGVETDDPGIGRGAAGLALFFAHYGADCGDDGLLDRGKLWLRRAVRAVSTLGHESLYSGVSGIGWTLEYLAPADPGDPDPNTAIDERLLRQLSTETWTGHYDLISGLVGHAVYALSRLPRPAAVAILERIIDHLYRLADRTGRYACWHTSSDLLAAPMRRRAPDGCYDLGVAHGTPGVIGVLAQITTAGVAVSTARPLLERAIAWLHAQRLEGEAGFPAWFARGSDTRTPGRSAWCYGDPGIAAVLLRSAHALGEAEWLDLAKDIARVAASRPIEHSGVVDACICHGAFGLGLTFLRCSQIANDPLLWETSRKWFLHGLATRRPDLSYFDPATQGWNRCPGFLDGCAGAGLALLAAVSGEEPSWDRLLLLS